MLERVKDRSLCPGSKASARLRAALAIERKSKEQSKETVRKAPGLELINQCTRAGSACGQGALSVFISGMLCALLPVHILEPRGAGHGL